MICAGKFYAIHNVTYRYRSHSFNFMASIPKTRDLILVLTDDLLLAKEHHLDRLYELTVERCCVDCWRVLSAAEGFEDEEVHEALTKLNDAVDLRFLKSGAGSDIDKLYFLRENNREYNDAEQKLATARKEINDIP